MAHHIGKISVIIPTYNRANCIRRAINSVLMQGYDDIELIISDDGSTDNTRELVSEYNDDRIVYIQSSNSGLPASARNRAIRISTGTWLAFLDSDDEWLDGKLNYQIDAIINSGLSAASTNAWRIADGVHSSELFLQWNRKKITFSNMLVGDLIINSSLIIRKSIVIDCGMLPEDPRLKSIEDYALWMRTMCLTDVAFVNLPLLNYYDNSSDSVRTDAPGYFQLKSRVWSNSAKWLIDNGHLGKSIALNLWWIFILANPIDNISNALKIYKRRKIK